MARWCLWSRGGHPCCARAAVVAAPRPSRRAVAPLETGCHYCHCRTWDSAPDVDAFAGRAVGLLQRLVHCSTSERRCGHAHTTRPVSVARGVTSHGGQSANHAVRNGCRQGPGPTSPPLFSTHCQCGRRPAAGQPSCSCMRRNTVVVTQLLRALANLPARISLCSPTRPALPLNL